MDWWPDFTGKKVTVECFNLLYLVHKFFYIYFLILYLHGCCLWEIKLDKTCLVFDHIPDPTKNMDKGERSYWLFFHFFLIIHCY